MSSQKPAPKLTISDLDLCVPIFRVGLDAEAELFTTQEHSSDSLVQLETRVESKRLVVDYLVTQSKGLIVNEVAKLLKTSVLPDPNDSFHQLYYAGVKGFERGLAKYSSAVQKQSATNYLFQWVFTYAKRELMSLEAPMGMPPTRYERLKKISAVRRRLTEKLGHAVTNEELLEFFHSGGADTMNKMGRLKNAGKPSAANRKLALADMEEQEELEKRMKVQLVDIQDVRISEKLFQAEEHEIFAESLFGTFVSQYSFSDRAIAVLRSELQSPDDEGVSRFVSQEAMSTHEYRKLARLWNDFIQDPTSPFGEFLRSEQAYDFESLAGIVDSPRRGKNFSESHYAELYETSAD